MKNWEVLWQRKLIEEAVRAQKKPYLSLGDSHSFGELFATAEKATLVTDKWEKTLNYDLKNDYKDKYIFTNEWPIPSLRFLEELDKNQKLKMMEVGCQEGRTSLYLLHPDSRMYCLDLWGEDQRYYGSVGMAS